jgi:CRISPR type IV-associated protein Csf2
VLFELLAARGEKLSLDAYHVAMCGAPSGIPDGETMKISEAFAAMSHPYVGIFGGGRRFTRSCLSVGEGWPVHPLTLAAGLIPDSMREQAVAHKKRGQANYDTNWLTHNLFSTKKDDVLTFTNGMMNVIEDAEAAVSAWNARLGESRDRKKAAEKAAKDGTDAEADNGKKISLAGVHAHEVVLPGVTFHSRLLVDDSLVNAAGLGLLIHSIIRFANTGQHGGRKQVGMGRFNLASATINGAALVALAPDGTVEPCVDTEIVGKACDAWAAYATTVTAANLTAVLLT